MGEEGRAPQQQAGEEHEQTGHLAEAGAGEGDDDAGHEDDADDGHGHPGEDVVVQRVLDSGHGAEAVPELGMTPWSVELRLDDVVPHPPAGGQEQRAVDDHRGHGGAEHQASEPPGVAAASVLPEEDEHHRCGPPDLHADAQPQYGAGQQGQPGGSIGWGLLLEGAHAGEEQQPRDEDDVAQRLQPRRELGADGAHPHGVEQAARELRPHARTGGTSDPRDEHRADGPQYGEQDVARDEARVVGGQPPDPRGRLQSHQRDRRVDEGEARVGDQAVRDRHGTGVVDGLVGPDEAAETPAEHRHQ